MTKVHIGHDATIESDVTLSSSSIVGGHSSVMRGANIGLGAAIHQKRVVGPYAMLGMGAVAAKSIDPFVIAMGVPAKPSRVNHVGMKRAGFNDDEIRRAVKWYMERYEIAGATQIWDDSKEADYKIKLILDSFDKRVNDTGGL